jgi:hypothetical protein
MNKWREGIIELKTDGMDLVVSIERNGHYIEVIREYAPYIEGAIGHAVHPSGINECLENYEVIK